LETTGQVLRVERETMEIYAAALVIAVMLVAIVTLGLEYR
jgi:hypothetical protein